VLSLRLAVAGMTVCAVVAASGCGGRASTVHAGGSRSVHIQLEDFAIKAPRRVRAGEVDLVVRNDGPTNHELLVAPDRRGRLPLRADGLTVDEDKVQPLLVGEVEPFPSGTSKLVRARLRPGRYVLFCNMSGHYLGGMRAELVVAS
jgi:uncharacterized cupredoxin-like copper-binding protein